MDRKLFRILLCEIIEANISLVKSISFRYGMSFTGHSSDLLEITVHLLLPLKNNALYLLQLCKSHCKCLKLRLQMCDKTGAIYIRKLKMLSYHYPLGMSECCYNRCG